MAGSRRRAQSDFKAFDKDGSGDLDFGEFCKLVRTREPGHHKDDELKARFEELDKDKSGRIDVQEYVGFALLESLTHSRVRLIDLLDSMDSDKNRKVSRSEFRTAVKKLGFDATVEVIDLVFAALDEDRNGEHQM